MALELQCQKCEESFSMDVSDLSAEPELRCPGCGARAPEEQVETLVAALEEAISALAGLRRKFSATIELDSEDLPVAEDAMAGREQLRHGRTKVVVRLIRKL